MALSAVKGTIERALDKNLQDLVRGIRNHKNDEAKYINDCMEEIKLELKLNSSASKPNAVLKLVYLQMLGYAVGWASFNVVEVMSSSKFIHKRIGYLAASQTFHPKCDVLMLTTNLIRKDLRNSNMYDASIALSGLACFMTQDLAVNLYNDVLAMATSHKPYIRKKSVLLLFKVFLNHPEALRSCFPQLKEKLEDPDPGVQAAAVNVICELARKNPKNYLSLAPIFFKLMTTSTNNWVLIKIIKLFGALTPIEPRLGKKLIEPLTNLILSTSAMSLLYECINTVVAVLISISSAIPNHQDSIQLCVQKLRMLIEDSDQNLKYLGLLALTKIMRHHPNSVQSHKDLILGCLDDKDESIRLRALNLLHGMTTKHNLVEVVKILAKHVRNPSNGSHFRQELVNKIVELCSQDNYQCVTSFEWYVTVLVELARIDTVQAGEMLASQLIEVTIRVPSVRQFCVEQMAILFDLCSSDPNLNARPGALLQTVQAASWICGEYGSNLEDPRHTVESMLQVAYQLPALSNNVRSITILNAFKIYCSLISRWANNAREDRDDENAKDHLDQRIHHILDTTVFLADQFTLFVHSPDLEVQERAVTLHQLLCLIQKRLEKLRTRLNGPVPPINSPINGQAGDDMSNPSSTVDSERSWTCSVHASLCALAHELDRLFAGEINPVAPKAQRKVPIPEGLDLDSWINTPFDSKDIRDAIRIREPGDSRVSQSRDSNKLSHHPDLFPNLSSPSPKVTLTREQLEEVRLQRLSRVQNDPHYLKPVPSKQVDNPPQSDGPPASNMSVQNGEVKQRPRPVRQFARSEQFVKEIQRNMDAAKVRAKESRPKKSRAKISKDKSSRAMNGLHSTPPDTDPSAPVYNQPDGVTPLVRRDLDMPPGVTIDDISSDEKVDLNDPHRHLNIALDTTMPSDSRKKLDPNLVRHSKRTKRKNRQVDAGPSVPCTEPSRMGDDQAVRSPIGFSPTLTPNKPTLMAPSANFSSIPLQFSSKSISVDQFAELVSSGQLSVSLNVKLSIRKDSDMVLILDRLTNQLPCSVVESISSRIVSLYTEQSQNPLCILTKLANQPGFVNVAIRSTDAEAASGCLNRIKSILKQSDER